MFRLPVSQLLCVSESEHGENFLIYFAFPANKWLKIAPLQVPLYWFANQGIVAPLLEKAGVPSFASKAQVDFFHLAFFYFSFSLLQKAAADLRDLQGRLGGQNPR